MNADENLPFTQNVTLALEPCTAKSYYPDGCAWRAAALVTVRAVQWSQPHVRQRYMLGESGDTLYCTFMGTKNIRRDLVRF